MGVRMGVHACMHTHAARGRPRRVGAHLRLELEVWGQRELDPQDGARDRLDVCRQVEAGELVDIAVDELAHLWESDELADLLRLEIVEALPREVLLLDLLDDVLGDPLELAQRGLGEPHALVDHLAKVEDAVGEGGPPSLEDNLVDATHQAARRLRDVDLGDGWG